MTTRHCPALLIAAPASGQGKTTVTAALARLHTRQGRRVRVFKCGPDFLDPMIHARASGAPVYQLDLAMVGEAESRRLLWQAAGEADLILIEGVMGLFDGAPSAADLARRFGVPVLTVIDGSAMAQTFGALAHGIGTSEVEHVLATQTLLAKKARNMLLKVEGQLAKGVTAKDITLTVIGETGTAGGNGHVIEYCGEAIRALSMEGRMTVCNMSIEAGARVGMVAVDEKTIAYVEGRPYAPKGADWDKAVKLWQDLVSDDDAVFEALDTLVTDGAVAAYGVSVETVASRSRRPGMVVTMTNW